MNTTTHLARHMLSFEPNKDAARLCLYHYLIHHCQPDTPLTPQLFEDFSRLALTFEHWQNQAPALSQELQYILQHYNETFMLDWNLKDFVFPDHWQVVPIKNSIEGIHIFEKWLETHAPEGSKNRVFYTRDKNYIILSQSPSSEVTVIHSSPLMLIKKGELQPLTMNARLHYNDQLELTPNKTQYLKVDQNSYARFSLQNKTIQGMIIRGYVFQNKAQLQGRLNEFPEVYYPLKKIEQYYVDRKTDPDYQELVQALEKSIELFRLQHPEAESFGEAALTRGRSALENIFINDNVIQALVDQLRHEINP